MASALQIVMTQSALRMTETKFVPILLFPSGVGVHETGLPVAESAIRAGFGRPAHFRISEPIENRAVLGARRRC